MEEWNVCTFTGERTALVCDLAIDRVRRELANQFARGITFTHVDYQPTLVEAAPDVDPETFQATVRAASAAAQTAAAD
jgi:hypothetical protein